MSIVRAAVVQAAPVVFDVPRTLSKLGDLATDAAKAGARLAVFPEAFVSACPKGLSFGTRIGMRSAEGREEFCRYARPDVFRLHVNERPGRRRGETARRRPGWSHRRVHGRMLSG